MIENRIVVILGETGGDIVELSWPPEVFSLLWVMVMWVMVMWVHMHMQNSLSYTENMCTFHFVSF